MLDIKFMRENADAVLAAMAALSATDAPVAEALTLDARRREILTRVEVLRAERNAGSKQIGQLMREGRKTEAQQLQAHMTQIGDEIKASRRGTGARRAQFHRRYAPHPKSAAARRAHWQRRQPEL